MSDLSPIDDLTWQKGDKHRKITAYVNLLKDRINTLSRYSPFIDLAVKLNGQGTSDPNILEQSNVSSVVREGVGIYRIPLTSQSIIGIPVTSGYPNTSWNIQGGVDGDTFKVTYSVGAENTLVLTVTRLFVPPSGKPASEPYDIQNTDNITCTVLLDNTEVI